MSKNHSLLLSSSHSYEISNFLEAIHQSVLDLHIKPQKDEVKKLLKKSFIYLDKEINSYQAEEIISLIYSCLSQYPDQSMEFYNDFFQNCFKNQYRIVVTAMIFSNFIDYNTCLQYSQFSVFTKTSSKGIYHHFHKNTNELIINEQTISPQFKHNFIIDIFSLIKPNQLFTSAICPYIFSIKNIQKFQLNKIINKIINFDIIELIPNETYLNEDFYKNLSKENLTFIIKKMNDDIFKKSLPIIEKIYENEKNYFESLSAELFHRCVKLDIYFKQINKLLLLISPSDLHENEWNYLAKYDVKIPENLANKITEFPNIPTIIKVIPNVNIFPWILMKDFFLQKFDLNTFMCAVFYDKLYENGTEIFSQSTFWINLMLAISESDIKFPSELISLLSNQFKKFVSKNDFFNIFNDMIFHHFPTSEKENCFLYELLKSFESDYASEFYDYRDIIIVKIIEMKVFPLPSFWKLFRVFQMKEMFENDDLHPIMYYAYEFAVSKDIINRIKKVKVKQLTNEISKNKIIEFIKINDLDYLKNVDEESLSLIISAIIFVNNNSDKPEINGLTKDTILPFFAILINYINKYNKKLFFIPQELGDLLNDACINLSNDKSNLQIVSIDSILSNYQFLFNSAIFPNKLANEIINNLFNLIKEGTYNADKTLFFKTIFNLSCLNSVVYDQFELFSKNGIDLFKCIISNLNMINQINCKLDLQVFKYYELETTIKNIFFDSKLDDGDIINLICFFEKNCKNVINLDFNKYEKAMEIFEKAIKESKWNESFTIEQFFKKNNCNMEFGSRSSYLAYIKHDYSSIFSDPEPETKNLTFELLFKSLMKSNSFSNDYFIILFEKISREQILYPNVILEKYYNEYEIYGDSFVKALGKIFSYDSLHKVFIRKTEFESISLPISNFGTVLISNIIKKITNNTERFQIFISLKNIAASFPFLFIESPEKIFDIVATAFKYFSLFYKTTIENDNDDERIKNQIKTAFSALSFMETVLYSVKMLDFFIPWIFENITKFDTSQIMAFSDILISLFNTDKIDNIILAISMKFNFQKIISKLLGKMVEQELYFYYKSRLYELITLYYILLYKASVNNEFIYVDEIQNVKNPFNLIFNNFSTILPYQLSPIKPKQPIVKNKFVDEILYFISVINEPKPFWMTYDRPSIPVSSNQIEKFVKHFKKVNPNNLEIDFIPSLPFIPSIDDIKIKRFLAVQPNWIYQWIAKGVTFPLLPEHNKILSNTIKKIQKIRNESYEYGDDDYDYDNNSDLNVVDYFLPQFCPKELIDLLIVETTTYEDDNYFLFWDLINQMTEVDAFLIIFLDKLDNFLSHLKNKPNSLDLFKKLLKALSNVKKFKDYKFKNSFFQICGNNLLDVALSPKCRNDLETLKYLTNVLNYNHENKSFSFKIAHLIGFILIQNDKEILPKALHLCKKIGKENFKYIFKIIENSFDLQMNDPNPSYSLIYQFFKSVPLLLRKKKSILSSLLNNIIEKYKYDKKNELINLIVMIFNSLEPEPDQDRNIILMNEIDFSTKEDSKNENSNKNEEKFLLLSSIQIKKNEKNEKFWELYENHRPSLNEILQENKGKINELHFLNHYPFLLSFQYRLKNFRDKMKTLINDNELLRIKIRRSNILHDSFNQLYSKKHQEWLYRFIVIFNGESGIDAGGVTIDFFTKITEELFNSNNALFKQTDNKCYIPNPSSGVNPEHLQYFRFAGKIIARSIIQENCVNAHLTTSFLRQILHQQIEFDDLKKDDEVMYKSFQDLLNNDADPLMLNFITDNNDFGDNKCIQLKENGDEIDVTNENKLEYAKLYISYKLRKSIFEQINAFREGFNALIPYEDICMFSPKELDLIICGIGDIDIADLKRNAQYTRPYSSNHPVMKMCFNVISNWNNKNLSKLLYFFTGSERVPVNGFKDYKERGKPITFSYGGSKDKLCVAHTCVNRLDIPEYDNEDEMNEKLLKAIEICEFGTS